MFRQIYKIKPDDVATVRSKDLLAKEFEEFYLKLRESFAVLYQWRILVVQSEQHLINRLMALIKWGLRPMRPKMMLTENNCHEPKLTTGNPQERNNGDYV